MQALTYIKLYILKKEMIFLLYFSILNNKICGQSALKVVSIIPFEREIDLDLEKVCICLLFLLLSGKGLDMYDHNLKSVGCGPQKIYGPVYLRYDLK